MTTPTPEPQRVSASQLWARFDEALSASAQLETKLEEMFARLNEQHAETSSQLAQLQQLLTARAVPERAPVPATELPPQQPQQAAPQPAPAPVRPTPVQQPQPAPARPQGTQNPRPAAPRRQNGNGNGGGRSAFCGCGHDCWRGYKDAAQNGALPCACGPECLTQYGKPCGCRQPQPGLFLAQVGHQASGHPQWGWVPPEHIVDDGDLPFEPNL